MKVYRHLAETIDEVEYWSVYAAVAVHDYLCVVIAFRPPVNEKTFVEEICSIVNHFMTYRFKKKNIVAFKRDYS